MKDINPLIYLVPKDVENRFILESETPTKIIVPGH